MMTSSQETGRKRPFEEPKEVTWTEYLKRRVSIYFLSFHHSSSEQTLQTSPVGVTVTHLLVQSRGFRSIGGGLKGGSKDPEPAEGEQEGKQQPLPRRP